MLRRPISIRPERARQGGFSLTDLMIGLFVGLLVSLAVYSSAVVVGALRRSATSANGALEAGVGALNSMQRDIKAAGAGIWMGGRPLCRSLNLYRNGTLADGAAIAPIVISAGAASTASDAITVAYGESVLANSGISMVSGMVDPSSPMRATNARGITANDLVLVANPGSTMPCTLMQVTGTTDFGTGWDIAHATTAWNPVNYGTAFTNAPAYPAGSMVYRIGRLNWLTYRVANGNLEVIDLVAGITDVLARNIVQLKAYYGTSNGSSPQIEQWVPATDAWASPLDTNHIAAIRAIRFVVVARSANREKPSVAGASCDATTTPPESWPGGPAIDLSAIADWQCYRYRTLPLVVPLKNLLFGLGAA